MENQKPTNKITTKKPFWESKKLTLLCNAWIKEEIETKSGEYMENNYSKSTIYQNLTFQCSHL